MLKLNLTSTILDKLGFSEYWDEHGTWGGRTLTFKNGVQFRIAEQEEMNDDSDGYGSNPTYVANHYYFTGWFALPKIDAPHHDLFFLHDLLEVIEANYTDCFEEFMVKCNKLNMGPYVNEYLAFYDRKILKNIGE